MEKENYLEQILLQVAEEEFIKKGFQGAKTFVIAKKAGVSLPTFYSYFKTKKDLFQIIFLQKVKMVSVSLLMYDESLSLGETIKNITEHHFDLIAKNPGLVKFIYNEVMSNDEHRKLLINTLSSELFDIYVKFGLMIKKEVEERKVRRINPSDLLTNMFALNVFSFMTYSAMKDLMLKGGQDEFDKFMKNRKESNVQFILNAIRP